MQIFMMWSTDSPCVISHLMANEFDISRPKIIDDYGIFIKLLLSE